jgi:hypothetical protein
VESGEEGSTGESFQVCWGVMAISAAVLGLFTFLIIDEDEEDDFSWLR